MTPFEQGQLIGFSLCIMWFMPILVFLTIVIPLKKRFVNFVIKRYKAGIRETTKEAYLEYVEILGKK